MQQLPPSDQVLLSEHLPALHPHDGLTVSATADHRESQVYTEAERRAQVKGQRMRCLIILLLHAQECAVVRQLIVPLLIYEVL